MNAAQKYSMFHGKNPRKLSRINVHIPTKLVRLGRAVAIEYECDKLNGGGDGKKAVYRHDFGKDVILAMDEKAKNQLYIIGKRVVITDRGIEH